MKLLKNMLVAILFLLAITFALKNNEVVTIRYYFQITPLEIPLYLLVFISVVFGILIGGGEVFIERFRNSRMTRRLKKELAAKEKELTSLRNLPITDSHTSAQEVEPEDRVQKEE